MWTAVSFFSLVCFCLHLFRRLPFLAVFSDFLFGLSEKNMDNGVMENFCGRLKAEMFFG